MYYDRVPVPELLALLHPGGPIRWLVDLAVAEPGMHLQLRRSRGGRARGSVQLYLGRTSPLEVVAASAGLFRLGTHRTYAVLDPELFARDRTYGEVGGLRPRLEAFVRGVQRTAAASFTDGEAVAQVGLLRRYGPLARAGDPFVALDSEVVIGFDSRPDRDRYEASLRADLQLRDVHRELDVVGVLADGSVALVELKAPGGDLHVAVAQAASHVHRFSRLPAGWEVRGLGALAEAKRALGLLPYAPVVAVPPRLVPIVAAPDLPATWCPLRPDLAAGVRLWRLGGGGEILEERRP
ncbi:MAG: hypothetical protein ACOZNI_07900 [Myxococcota bacterium]